MHGLNQLEMLAVNCLIIPWFSQTWYSDPSIAGYKRWREPLSNVWISALPQSGRSSQRHENVCEDFKIIEVDFISLSVTRIYWKDVEITGQGHPRCSSYRPSTVTAEARGHHRCSNYRSSTVTAVAGGTTGVEIIVL